MTTQLTSKEIFVCHLKSETSPLLYEILSSDEWKPSKWSFGTNKKIPEAKSLLSDFNLLITTARGNEEDACTEIWYLLGELGDQAAKIDRTGVKGLVVAKTSWDPFEVIKKFRNILKDRPSEFRYALRVIPIEKVIRTDLNEIQKAVTQLASKMKQDATFRVTVEKRFSNASTSELIEAAAANIKRRVSLEKPDTIVLIEVIGALTGVSIIESTDIMSIPKERLSPRIQTKAEKQP